MLEKLKKLSLAHKSWGIFVICATVLFGITLYFGEKPSGFMLYLIVIIGSYPAQNAYQQKRIKEINYMWNLADDFHITSAKLSEVTGIGRLDLEATKRDENGIYLPPRKDIQKGITYLETLSTT